MNFHLLTNHPLLLVELNCLKHLLHSSRDDALQVWIAHLPLHGVGLACASLPISKNVDFVTLHNRAYELLDLRVNLRLSASLVPDLVVSEEFRLALLNLGAQGFGLFCSAFLHKLNRQSMGSLNSYGGRRNRLSVAFEVQSPWNLGRPHSAEDADVALDSEVVLFQLLPRLEVSLLPALEPPQALFQPRHFLRRGAQLRFESVAQSEFLLNNFLLSFEGV